jgi:hypothetical protein
VGAGAHIPQPTAVGAVVQLSGGRSFRKRRTVNPPMVPTPTTSSTLPQGRPFEGSL